MTTEVNQPPAPAVTGNRLGSSALLGTICCLVPTEGCYQTEKLAEVVGETRTEISVRVNGERRIRRFRKSTMMHVSPHDRQFPNYRLRVWRTAKALEARGLVRCGEMSHTGHFEVFNALPNAQSET